MAVRRTKSRGGAVALALSLLLAGTAIERTTVLIHHARGKTAAGVVDDVAGHVPDQAEQVAQTPVNRSESPASRDWWSPGDARAFPEWVEYANDSGRLAVLNAGGGSSGGPSVLRADRRQRPRLRQCISG